MSGVAQHMRLLWRKPKEQLGAQWNLQLIQWRREQTVTTIEKPTRLDRARALGYKAKQGVVMARVKVKKGRRKVPKRSGGRRAVRTGRFYPLGKSKQVVAEEKAARKFPNLEVLNSYWVGQDGQHEWFEIILLDPHHPSIQSDKNLRWIAERQHTGRAFRGKTSAGRKSRGLR